MSHGATAEVRFIASNVSPDLCEVDGDVVAFDIIRELSHEHIEYADTVHANGVKTLKVGSVTEGVVGDDGKGIVSKVSRGDGNTIMSIGSPTVFIEGKMAVRHHDECHMNMK